MEKWNPLEVKHGWIMQRMSFAASVCGQSSELRLFVSKISSTFPHLGLSIILYKGALKFEWSKMKAVCWVVRSCVAVLLLLCDSSMLALDETPNCDQQAVLCSFCCGTIFSVISLNVRVVLSQRIQPFLLFLTTFLFVMQTSLHEVN